MVRPTSFRFVLLCFALLCVTAAANAADIHKCATSSGIVYQGLPCSGAELPAPLVSASAAASTPAPDPVTKETSDESTSGAPACGARPLAPRRLPWRQATICIGMTDDEVLNLPGWGRPRTIARTRAPREWREDWTFVAGPSGPRQLHFVNGKLTAVEREFLEGPTGRIVKLAIN